MSLFGADFFPTPPEVAALMFDPLDLRGKTILEPSAGSGNLVRECLARGAAEVLWCEAEPKLRSLLNSIGNATPAHGNSDFLQVQAADVSHIDLIVMNPPFSADEAHILYAWEIAPPGCEIVALCNWNTVCDEYVHRLTQRSPKGLQKQLANLINAYGSHESLGECFTTAERPTRVSVGMVRLRKPGQRVSTADEFDGFFLRPDDIEAQGEGLIPYRRSTSAAVITTHFAPVSATPPMTDTPFQAVKINGVTYVPETAAGPAALPAGDRAVFVVDRGFIYAGDWSFSDGQYTLTNPVNLRRYESIGFEGVLADPKSDMATIVAMPYPVIVPAGSVLFMVPVPKGWGL